MFFAKGRKLIDKDTWHTFSIENWSLKMLNVDIDYQS
jgi:hypothetical protein